MVVKVLVQNSSDRFSPNANLNYGFPCKYGHKNVIDVLQDGCEVRRHIVVLDHHCNHVCNYENHDRNFEHLMRDDIENPSLELVLENGKTLSFKLFDLYRVKW